MCRAFLAWSLSVSGIAGVVWAADYACCLNRGLRRFSQMGYDAPRRFGPGFWIPACAGMTMEVGGLR